MQPAAATHVVASASEELVVGGGNNSRRSYDSNGVAELEDILRQKTFTRSEIDHLTLLLLSRTAEKSDDAEAVRAGPIPSHLLAVQAGCEKPSSSRNREFQIEHVHHPEAVSTPAVRSKVSEDVVSSPAEIAKAYMGSRPARQSLSLSSQNQVPKEDLPSPYDPFSKQTSPVMSLMRKPFNDSGASSNGLMTPRFRGRSAIYSMARTPYSRAHSVVDVKASETKFDVSGGSLYRNGTDNNLSERQVLKRRSSVLENDIGSVGPIRRIRQKPNLLHPKILSLPPLGGRIESNVPGRLTDVEGPSSVEQRSQNHSLQKVLTENTARSSSNGYVPSQTMETVQKIFEQLDNFTPKRSPEKKTDLSLGNSPTKMKSSMLNGSACESMEAETSSRALQGTHDSKRVNGALNSITAHHHSPSSRTEDVILKKLVIPSGNLPSQNGMEYSNAVSHVTSKVRTAEYMVPVSGVKQPQKKRAFQMSALEDSPELDDDVPSNEEILSNPLTEKRRYGDEPKLIAITDTTPQNEIVKGEKPLQSKPAADLFLRKEPESQANSSVAIGKTVGFASAPSSAPPTRMTAQDSGNAPQMTLKPDTSGSHNDSSNTFSSFFKSDKLPSSSFATSPFAAMKDTKSETPNSANVAAATSNGPDKNGTKSVQGSADLFMKSGDPSRAPAASSANGAFTFGMQTSNATASKEFQPDGAVPTTNQSSDHTVVSSSLVPGGIQVSIGSIGPSPTSAAADARTSIFASNSSNGSAVPASSRDLSSTQVPSFSASKFPSTSAASVDIIQISGPKSDDTGFVKTPNMFGVNPSSSVSSGNDMSATLKSSGVDAQTADPASSGVSFRFQTTATSASELAPSFGLAAASVSAPKSTSSASIFGNSNQSFSTSVSGLGVLASFSSGAISGSTAANPFSSLSSTSSLLGSTPSSMASLSATASVSTSNDAGCIFGSQPSKPTTPETTSTSALTTPNAVSFGIGSSGSSGAASNSFIFGAASKSSSSTSAQFIFGSSSGSASSIFATPSSAASTPAMQSPLQSQQPFGSTSSQPLTFGLNPSTNNNQVTMEDSMAEDSVQPSTPPMPGFGAPNSSSMPPFGAQASAPAFGAQPSVPAFGAQASVSAFGAPMSTPSVPSFGQPPVSASPGAFSFSASTPPAAGNPFQFMGQQNQFAPASASFQPSGSGEFNGGQGSFSLGTNGGDKSQRRFVKPRKKVGRK